MIKSVINKIKKLFEYEQIRFLFVGGLNTIVGYGSYALLLLVGLNFVYANTISYIIGVIHSYIWNKKFTFKSNNKSILEVIKFIGVYVINYLIGLAFISLFIKVFGINEYLAGALNLVVTTLISYFGHKYFSFASKSNKVGVVNEKN